MGNRIDPRSDINEVAWTRTRDTLFERGIGLGVDRRRFLFVMQQAKSAPYDGNHRQHHK